MGKITVRRKGFVARARKKQWVVHRKGKRIIAKRRKKTWRVSGTVYKKEDILKNNKRLCGVFFYFMSIYSSFMLCNY